ncbi:hypothetical protein BCR41DRAFT_365071 [Lobosporangium transversale]|uniref:F-box domain-containing protein n=1 Tax=Lobosporangium transversale TaxID=64571 RepID=A0A1Y2G5P5_9FUNG|nr:hypothetical protein BCR41DRAFT_365071 [Lobosporangium transversale]ORY95980.1 hypothetical protein BCR41DRAFT_365071 [Lobosporangium transversale]|eukprot:XP_021875421.1 hypothetical protein BCR41DRAFT_365071 [Lobosporangium transversale]
MMNNLKLNPLEIPELISLVGGYLSRNDLCSCIRVSKLFHDTLIKYVWRRITVGCRRQSQSCYPTKKALKSHKKYIEELVFYYRFPDRFMSLQGCDRLRSIEYSYESLSSQSQILNLIKSHSSTIVKLKVDCSSLREIWRTLLGCAHLEDLAISTTYISGDEVDLFFQVFKKLKRLDMERVYINHLPSDFLNNDTEKFIFPNANTLRLIDVVIFSRPHPHTSSSCLGMLTRGLPALHSYDSEWDAQTVHDFCKTVFLQRPYTASSISDLCLRVKIKDEDMAAILRQITVLRRLDIPFCDFGPLSIRELLADEQEITEDGHIVRKKRGQRLCDSVEILELRHSEKIDGVVQTILSNCPRLKRLRGYSVAVTEIADGAEWVCTGLTDMKVRLVVDVDQKTAKGIDSEGLCINACAS